ncbi:hypothetical protein OQA88_11831 [Cercophora sp. LCS_1]
MFRAPEAMHSWLSQVSSNSDDRECPDERPRKRCRLGLDMATPSSSAARSASPSKKRKTDGNGADPEPMTSWPSRLTTRTLPPSLPDSAAFSTNPPSTSSHRQTQSSRGSRRSASPVKNMVGLNLLEKPVYFHDFPDSTASEHKLPDDVRQLYSDILEAVEYKNGIYPAEIRAKIEETNPVRRPPSCAFREPRQQQQQQQQQQHSTRRSRGEEDDYFGYTPMSILRSAAAADGTTIEEVIARAEFNKVCRIRDVTEECLALRRSEAAWNAQVHEPVLCLAFSRPNPSAVLIENATAARILPCFLPALSAGGSGVVDSKLVDYTVMPNLGPGFDAIVRPPPNSSGMTIADLCINQTEYHPLQRFPVAVSIETKVAGANLEEGRMQLAIWTAAWHKRMEQFGLGGKYGPPLPTLPLILTHDQRWDLFFAVDHRDKIEILGPQQIGTTGQLEKIYQLLTALRHIGTWVDSTFRNWAIEMLWKEVDLGYEKDA